MKYAARIAAVVLTLTVAFAFVPFFGSADAAAKKKVTVVKSMKITFDSNVTYKDLKKNTIKYKNGFITKYKDTEGTYTLSYDKNYKVKKLKAKMNGKQARFYNYTQTYTWKNNKMIQIVQKSGDVTNTFNNTYNGNKIVKSDLTWSYKGDTEKSSCTYTYKKNHISKSVLTQEDGTKLSAKYKFDKKGNVIQGDVKAGKTANSTTLAHITYGKNKLPSQIQATFISYESQQAYTAVYKFTYKTIKVPKKYVKAVKEQQWKLLNDPSANDVSRGESLAW